MKTIEELETLYNSHSRESGRLLLLCNNDLNKLERLYIKLINVSLIPDTEDEVNFILNSVTTKVPLELYLEQDGILTFGKLLFLPDGTKCFYINTFEVENPFLSYLTLFECFSYSKNKSEIYNLDNLSVEISCSPVYN